MSCVESYKSEQSFSKIRSLSGSVVAIVTPMKDGGSAAIDIQVLVKSTIDCVLIVDSIVLVVVILSTSAVSMLINGSILTSNIS